MITESKLVEFADDHDFGDQWVTYYFTSEAGEMADPMCEGINNAVNGFLAFIMAALSIVPIPGAGGAANAAGNAVKAGTTEARTLAAKAIGVAESKCR